MNKKVITNTSLTHESKASGTGSNNVAYSHCLLFPSLWPQGRWHWRAPTAVPLTLFAGGPAQVWAMKVCSWEQAAAVPGTPKPLPLVSFKEYISPGGLHRLVGDGDGRREFHERLKEEASSRKDHRICKDQHQQRVRKEHTRKPLGLGLTCGLVRVMQGVFSQG